ncbi:unnamed protein product [Ilex paraguariensis]|uniref:Fe2OG dioxygenase domain-containing protein n=1 Tax=Ilex paraguariensis TaxID=185542 RepID=A0ABC8TS02_9AQUA
MATIITTNPDPHYNRLEEAKKLDETKTGVKGLVDSGITIIPRIFHNPPQNQPIRIFKAQNPKLSLPIVDLSGHRSMVVDQIHHAASTFGFFQIMNHGIPKSSMDHMLSSIKSFHELPETTKMQYYSRDTSHGVTYFTNFDLYKCKEANWRDSLEVHLGPTPLEREYVPEVCREALVEWDGRVVKLGEELMGMLCEGLGVEKERLKKMSFFDKRNMSGHYYPYCPQPELTMGLKWHTDPVVLTVLLVNEVTGLQVKHCEDWIDVEPVPGGLIVNIGDMLQMISNDEYKSVEHRVLANPNRKPRVSVPVFFTSSMIEDSYEPLLELVSSEKPAVYQKFTISDFMNKFYSEELQGKSVMNTYKHSNI